MQGNVRSGLSRLFVPADPNDFDYKNCTEWLTIDTPKDIETRLHERTKRHFGQAQGTFPTIPPFSEWLDWGSSTHVAELILECNFHNDDLTSLQSDLVNHMKARSSLDAIPDLISKSDWVDKIRSWKESTLTSPSGHHLGHSKALLAPHDESADSKLGLQLEIQWNDSIQWQILST
jgi:hypothetical protein